MNGLLMWHILILKQLNRLNVCVSPKHCSPQNYMYHLSHIGISTVGEKYYSPRTLCLHTVGDHMCPEAVGHNLDIGEDSLGLSWQHSVQTDIIKFCSSMIMLYKLSQRKPSVSLSLLHLSWTVKRTENPQQLQPCCLPVTAWIRFGT